MTTPVENKKPEGNKAELNKYLVLAPFEWGKKQYQTGDVFEPPAEWKRDAAFEEFRNMERKRGAQHGLAFTYEAEIARVKNEKTGATEPVYDARRVILPLEQKAA